MMGKVVDDGDAIHFGADLETTLDALEIAQCFCNLFFCDSICCRHDCRRGGIPYVVFAGERELEIAPRFGITQDRP